MRDFTSPIYNSIIKVLLNQGFSFQPFLKFIEKPNQGKTVILRHDVDKVPINSLKTAEIGKQLGINGSYYFRIVDERFDSEIIRQIAEQGHEVGYHYEDLDRCAVRGIRYAEEDLAKLAIESFQGNLEKLRKIVPVKTICMHGSPMSKWDSRLLWKYYDYHDFGIVGEPYFDVNFEEVIYLTDTGRRWDGGNVSVRDKAQSREYNAHGLNPFENWKVQPISVRLKATNINPPLSTSPSHRLIQSFHSTFDIIRAAEEGMLPDKIMMTFHPQRWTDKPVPWVKELVWQNVKNMGKYFLIKMRSQRI